MGQAVEPFIVPVNTFISKSVACQKRENSSDLSKCPLHCELTLLFSHIIGRLDINELKRKTLSLYLNVLWDQQGAGFYSFLATYVELYPIASNSKCCWCTQTCKFVFPRASYTQSGTLRAPDLPLSQTSETATVWAVTCNQHGWQWWRQCFSPGTRMMAAERGYDCGSGSGSKCGCLSSAALGKKLWPSSLLAALAEFCAGLPSGRSRRGFAGGFGKRRLHPPGPGDAGRRPPRE